MFAPCRTRNPGGNPSSSWAGLFTFSGGVLTTGPNGNGVSEQLGPTQWTFLPNDPAQACVVQQGSAASQQAYAAKLRPPRRSTLVPACHPRGNSAAACTPPSFWWHSSCRAYLTSGHASGTSSKNPIRLGSGHSAVWPAFKSLPHFPLPPTPTRLQMAIFPQSTVMVTFCCDTMDPTQVKATFRV